MSKYSWFNIFGKRAWTLSVAGNLYKIEGFKRRLTPLDCRLTELEDRLSISGFRIPSWLLGSWVWAAASTSEALNNYDYSTGESTSMTETYISWGSLSFTKWTAFSSTMQFYSAGFANYCSTDVNLFTTFWESSFSELIVTSEEDSRPCGSLILRYSDSFLSLFFASNSSISLERTSDLGPMTTK